MTFFKMFDTESVFFWPSKMHAEMRMKAMEIKICQLSSTDLREKPQFQQVALAGLGIAQHVRILECGLCLFSKRL